MILALLSLTVWIGGNIALLGAVVAAQVYGRRKLRKKELNAGN